MNPMTSPSELQRLRAKTDQQLVVLLRRELKRGMMLVKQSRVCEAKQSFETAEALLAMARLSPVDRLRLQGELDEFREALSARAMTAA